MAKNTVILSAGLLLGVMLAITMVSALTINTPTASQAINGTHLFNVTTAIDNVLNCTWSTTANANFAITLNSSADQADFTNSSNTASLTEVEDTTLTVLCRNSTASESATRTISIDNTDPSCSFTIDQDHVQRQSGLGILISDGSTDTTDITYLYNLTNEEGMQKQTSTSAEPTFSNGDLEDLGEHTVTLTVTDEVGKTDSCTATFFIKGTESSKEVVVQSAVSQKLAGDSNMLMFVFVGGGVLLLIVIAGVAWYVLEGTKRKRR